jgi:hypothetical protein
VDLDTDVAKDELIVLRVLHRLWYSWILKELAERRHRRISERWQVSHWRRAPSGRYRCRDGTSCYACGLGCRRGFLCRLLSCACCRRLLSSCLASTRLSSCVDDDSFVRIGLGRCIWIQCIVSRRRFGNSLALAISRWRLGLVVVE